MRETTTVLRDPFLKGLRDQLRPLVMWSAGVAFYVALLISIYPSIRKSAGAIQEYVKNMPEGIKAAFMGSSDFSTPVGYVNVELLSWLAPIVLIGFACAVAARALAGEEESGTLSLVLTHTVGRRRLVLQKYAAMVVVVVALGAVFWLSLSIATAIAGTPVGTGDLAKAFLGLTLLGLAIGSVTYAVSAATGRRQVGNATGAGVAVAMYLLNTLAVMNESIRPFRFLSLFHYAGGAAPLGRDLDVTDLIVLLATSAVMLAATLVLFERRDVHV
jgi:ABC-2 type transport system permease protein